jgi:hypothetical protein
MQNDKQIRVLIKSILLEVAKFDKELTGKYNNQPALVFGPGAKSYLTSPERGDLRMSDWEFNTVFERLNNTTLEDFQKYDKTFTKHGKDHRLKPSLLKAMSIEETTLGKNLINQSGGSAAGLIQITKGTIDTLNNNLPKGVHYSYNDVLSNPAFSVKVVAHYIRAYLMDKRGLADRASILTAYKTGPDSVNYIKRVNAFKKLVDVIGL